MAISRDVKITLIVITQLIINLSFILCSYLSHFNLSVETLDFFIIILGDCLVLRKL